MAELEVRTEDGFGEKGIFPRRVISVNGKAKPTPAAAIPIDRLEEDEDVHPQSRGINEIHIRVDRDKILERSESDDYSITSQIESALENADEKDEINFVFTTYVETEDFEVDGETEKDPVRLQPDEAERLVKTTSEKTDILPVPMFRELQYAVDDELASNDPYFLDYLRSVVTFLNHAEEHAPDTPIMGVLPGRVSWECLERLFEIYEAFNVRAFNLNLDRLKFTANNQLEVIEELMQHVVDLELEDKSLFYLFNGERGDYDAEIEAFPASDLAAIGFGFDIIGGRRFPPRMDYDEVDFDEDTFYICDRTNHVYHKDRLRHLSRRSPLKSGFDVEYLVNKSRESPMRDRYRLQALVNAEQLSLAAMAYRKEGGNSASPNYFREKPGVTQGIGEDMIDIRESFDNAITNRGQTGIDEY